MNEQFEQLKARLSEVSTHARALAHRVPKPDKSAWQVFALAVLLVAGAWYAPPVNMQEKKADIADQRLVVESAQAELAEVENRIRKIEAGEPDSIVELAARAAILDGLLPHTSAPSQVALELPELASANGLELTTFSKGSPATSPNANLKFVPYSIAVRGNTTNVTAFITALGEYDRLLTLNALNIVDRGDGTVEAKFTVQAWQTLLPELPTEVEPATPQPDDGTDGTDSQTADQPEPATPTAGPTGSPQEPAASDDEPVTPTEPAAEPTTAPEPTGEPTG